MAELSGSARNSALLRVSTEIAKAFIASGAYNSWTAERVAYESHEVACEIIDKIYTGQKDCK